MGWGIPLGVLSLNQGVALSEGAKLMGAPMLCQGALWVQEHMKCLYTNACSVRNKRDKLEPLVLSQSYDIIGICETWWDESCDRSAVQKDYAGPARQGCCTICNGEIKLYSPCH